MCQPGLEIAEFATQLAEISEGSYACQLAQGKCLRSQEIQDTHEESMLRMTGAFARYSVLQF